MPIARSLGTGNGVTTATNFLLKSNELVVEAEYELIKCTEQEVKVLIEEFIKKKRLRDGKEATDDGQV